MASCFFEILTSLGTSAIVEEVGVHDVVNWTIFWYVICHFATALAGFFVVGTRGLGLEEK